MRQFAPQRSSIFIVWSTWIVTRSRRVAVNAGSAHSMLTKVLLKALNLCPNVGRRLRSLTTADMDFVAVIGSRVNVRERLTEGAG
jgi:hypothetical protein